jgi:MFS superfamily sulfate permease-like transporter
MFKPKFFSTIKDYSFQQFYKDLVAGIIVAIIALPLSIALATASGVAPEQGLYTAIIAGFIISFLGGSRVQIGGPFFFGSANNLLDTIHTLHLETEYLILDMMKVHFIDTTGINSLKILKKGCKKLGIQLIVVEADEKIQVEVNKLIVDVDHPITFYDSLKDTVELLEG